MASKKSSHAWRPALFVFFIACIFWLGASNIRAIIGYDLLKFDTFEFDEYLATEAEGEIFRLLSFTSLVVIASYIIALVSSIVFLATSPFRMKEHGWLLISAILFYLFVPVEFFTMYLDGQMFYQEFFATADNQMLREIFIARVGSLAGAPIIATLCYYTIVGLAVFQPLRKSRPLSA